MERLDALAVRESGDKSFFTKIGAAFPNKDGKGFTVLLDAIPAPADGQFKIMLRVPLPKDGADRDRQHRANLGSGATGKGYADLDDDIAF